jgi:hypothetical protein
MSEVPGINERMAVRPVYVDRLSELTKAMGLTEDAQVLAKDIVGLLASQPSVRVTNLAAPAATSEVGTPTGATGVPSLDNPSSEVQREVDLEKLISYLQLENEKQQAELAKDRIELQKNELEQRHGEQMEKINESLEQMDKAASMNSLSRLFGWLMAAAAVALAVVSCVATGGIAVGAVIGAVMAVGMCVMNETGVTEKLTEALADALKDAGMSKQAAQIVASLTVAVGMIVLSVGSGAVGSGVQNAMRGGAQVAMTASMLSAQSVQGGMRLGMGILGLGTTAVMGGAAAANYKSTELQADTTEMEKFMAVIQQQLEESQEELERILSQIQGAYSDIAAIINSSIDTENEIASKMGQMA